MQQHSRNRGASRREADAPLRGGTQAVRGLSSDCFSFESAARGSFDTQGRGHVVSAPQGAG
eukprot:2283320-Alexandrium_andersonii.AAC.1